MDNATIGIAAGNALPDVNEASFDADEIQKKIAELLQPVVEAFEAIKEAILKVFRVIGEAIKNLVDKLLTPYAQAAAAHPRWYHLAKHARKRRTRNKWENALWKEALSTASTHWEISERNS